MTTTAKATFAWLLLLLSSLVPSFSLAQQPPVSHEHFQHGALFLDTQQPQLPPQIHLSPQCWRNAMEASLGTTTATELLGTALCNHMSSTHQKRLALELANCHLADVGRDMFVPTSPCHDFVTRQSMMDSLTVCLRQLTDGGVTSYTHFFTHVHQTCLRLTSEVTIQYQQQVTEQLTQVSHNAGHVMQAMIEQHDMMQTTNRQRELETLNYQKQVMESMEEQWVLLQQQTLQLQSFQTNFDHVFVEAQQEFSMFMVEQQKLMFEQTTMVQDHVHQVLYSVKQRSVQQEAQFQESWKLQHDMLQEQVLELERQRERVAELHRAAAIVSTMMTPFLALNWVVALGRTVVSIFCSLPFPIGMSLVLYLLTMFQRTGRWRLILLPWVQVVLELVFGDAKIFRFWTKSLLVVVFLFHLFRRRLQNTSEYENKYHDSTLGIHHDATIMMMEKWQKELEAQRLLDTAERESRWMELLRQQATLQASLLPPSPMHTMSLVPDLSVCTLMEPRMHLSSDLLSVTPTTISTSTEQQQTKIPASVLRNHAAVTPNKPDDVKVDIHSSIPLLLSLVDPLLVGGPKTKRSMEDVGGDHEQAPPKKKKKNSNYYIDFK